MGENLERTGFFLGGRVRLFASIPARSKWRRNDPPTDAEIGSVHLRMDSVWPGFALLFSYKQQDRAKQAPADHCTKRQRQNLLAAYYPYEPTVRHLAPSIS